jgi:hypothetical protein
MEQEQQKQKWTVGELWCRDLDRMGMRLQEKRIREQERKRKRGREWKQHLKGPRV